MGEARAFALERVGAPGDAGDHVHRGAVQVGGEVFGRIDHPLHLLGVLSIALGLGQGVGALLHVAIDVEALAVEFADALPLGLVGHHHEMPALAVGAARPLEGDLQAFANQLRVHRAIEIEALAHGAGRGEQGVGGKVQGRHGGSPLKGAGPERYTNPRR